MDVQIQIGDKVRLKKPHPCGGYVWEILRTGADFRLKCCTCGHSVMISRSDAMKRIKEVLPADNTQK